MEHLPEKMETRMQRTRKYFSEQNFWTKLKEFAKKAGSGIVYTALLLYYTLQKPNVPKKAKATIIGALGYFILPTDLLPDILPVGFTDDLGALGLALVQVAIYIDDDVKAMAKEKLAQWFGELADTSEVDKRLDK
jgi:uncharacterized membrane protein YkvA (DUF1232 family)